VAFSPRLLPTIFTCVTVFILGGIVMKRTGLLLLVAAMLAYAMPAFAASGCEAENNRLMAEVQQASRQASTMGICQAAKTLVRIYGKAAKLLRRCPSLDPTGQDAGAYEQGARQAQQTANASCM
jgi:hypothetical protein